MTTERFHPIGTPGEPWTDADKRRWFEGCTVRRSYREDVLSRIERLAATFHAERYGALPIDPERYPLFALRTARPRPDLPWALITGGVHGYETSGVHGALAFLERHAADYADRLNLLVAPCVSPWGYETIQRWNPRALDPNRSFVGDGRCDEAAALTRLVRALDGDVLVHLDLHETTDTDETDFRPALAARNGEPFTPGTIPDGFYTVGDSENPQLEFQAAIVAAVAQVTHIAPPDANGEIIGAKPVQRGVIQYPCKALGLCAGVTAARYTTTTEVYPDSARVTLEMCVEAQVAAVRGALGYALQG